MLRAAAVVKSGCGVMRILGLSGSLRRDSYNTRLLHYAAALLGPDELVVFDGLRDLPPYDQDDDVAAAPASVARLRAAVGEADALLVATPEYNGSLPGVLKNALDWASRPRGSAALLGKPAGVIGASPGSFGAVWAQADARKVLATAGARVSDIEVAVPQAAQRLPQDGVLLDRDNRGSLARLLDDLRTAHAHSQLTRRIS
ncbi:NADPH-dependent FMN reductase [Jannaschia sp. R86511]|uniref:NADPH-dependent FMN reductase n=1 Tax=Jannaschia sp. R86511 TaxID=3093853 RepID=UPI0036D2DFD3